MIEVILRATLLMMIDATTLIGLAVPGEVCVMTFAARVPPSQAPFVAVGVVAGTLLGWSTSYLLGRLLRERLRSVRLGRWLQEGHWTQAERVVTGRAGTLLVLVQFMPVLNSLIPALAGSLNMPYRRFLTLAAIGSTAWAACYSTLGALSRAVGHPVGGLLMIGVPVMVAAWIIVARVFRAAATADSTPRMRRGAARTEPARKACHTSIEVLGGTVPGASAVTPGDWLLTTRTRSRETDSAR